MTLGGDETHQFVATVTGTTNAAVTWSISGCAGAACGTISSTGSYTAPAFVAASADVWVVATSQADPGKFGTVAVHLMPVAVGVTPLGAWVAPGQPLKFTASIEHDVTQAGVSWSLTCSSADCGTLSEVAQGSVEYIAPELFPDPPIVTLIATSNRDPNKTVRIAITEAADGTLSEGDYAFIFSGWEIGFSEEGYYWPYRYAVAGHFHADGNGNILDGVEDINSINGISQSVPFTGTYGIGSDRRGSLTIVTAQESTTYHMVLDPSGTQAKFIRFDGLPSDGPVSGAGSLALQDKAAFSLSTLNGDYAMGISGTGAGGDWYRIAAVGRFTVGSDGVIAGGKMDRTVQALSEPGTVSGYSTNLILKGSLAVPSVNTGRGMAVLAVYNAQGQALENLNFAYYVVSGDKLLLIETDNRGGDSSGSVLSGEARRQQGTFSAESFRGPTIFDMAGLNREGYSAYFEHVAVGQLVADGSSSMTGVLDDNSYPAMVNQAFYGTYSVTPDGRSELELPVGYFSRAVAYFYGPNQAFLLDTIPGADVLFGNIRPQSAGPFDPGSIAGTFLTVTAPPTSEEAQNESGLTTFDGEGSATASIDANENLNDDTTLWLQHFELNGTYTVASNGRGTLTFPSQTRTVMFWMISPTEIVGNAAMKSDGWSYADWAALLEFTR